MNIIVDKPQLVKVVKLYLTKSFGNLTLKTSKDYPYSVFYVNYNNKILMRYDEKTEKIWIDSGQIWSKLISLFYLNYGDIQLIIKDWLEEHYGLSGVIPIQSASFSHAVLDEHYKSSNL
jgi:hypothetical protein